jgi:NAD(P)-dependent dehydrogenase (short-subunit alcohol dehydrogenase family)
LYGYPRRGPYVASKWAVVGLTKSLAIELGPSGIRVNAICPGSIEGPRMDRVIAAEAAATGSSEEEVRQAYMRNTSMRCFIDAEDIANMAVFLCSPAGAKVSGQALAVDGHTESLAN